MKAYTRNGIPFLPISQGKDLCKDQMFIDIEDHFDLKSYTEDYYYFDQITIFNIPVQYEELLEVIGESNKHYLKRVLSNEHSTEVIDDFMDELEKECSFKLSKQIHISKDTDIVYLVTEFDDDITDDAVDLFFRLI